MLDSILSPPGPLCIHTAMSTSTSMSMSMSLAGAMRKIAFSHLASVRQKYQKRVAKISFIFHTHFWHLPTAHPTPFVLRGQGIHRRLPFWPILGQLTQIGLKPFDQRSCCIASHKGPRRRECATSSLIHFRWHYMKYSAAKAARCVYAMLSSQPWIKWVSFELYLLTYTNIYRLNKQTHVLHLLQQC